MCIRDRYVIITDSTCDLTPELVEEMDVVVIPMEFTLAEGEVYKNYPDGREIGFQAFYDRVRAGAQPKTNQINAATYMEVAAPYLDAGKDVLILAFSSALSGTYQSSVLATEELREKYPDRQIYTVDTLAASMGEGLLVYHAAKKRDEGLSITELARWVEDNRLRLCHWFTVDDLNHLKRGGRVSSAAALFGTILGIKPVMHVDDAGRLIPREKVRGRRQSLEALARHMLETIDPAEGEQTIFISHGDCEGEVQHLIDFIREHIRVKEIKVNYIGPVIGAHSGPGTVALFYLGKTRN